MEPLEFQTKKWIYLYENIVFKEQEILGWDEHSDSIDIEEEGYFYSGKSFRLTNLTDLTKDWKSDSIIRRIDFNGSLLKDTDFILQRLTDLNRKELANAKKELNYWDAEQKKYKVPVPLIQRRLEFCSTVIFYFNQWFAHFDKSNLVQIAKKQHKKDYIAEAKTFVNALLKMNQIDFNLRELTNHSRKINKTMSISTWSRRLNDVEFLQIVYKEVDARRKKLESKYNLQSIERLDQIIELVAIKISKVKKLSKKDLLDTSKVDRQKDVSEIRDGSQDIENYENSNNKDFSASYITSNNKLILN